jgi:quercetin dioxygenase-like cupin family protein
MENQQKVFKWDEMPKEQVNEKFGRRIVSGEKIMLTQIYLEKGFVVPWHSHENEQISYVVDGELKIWVGDENSDPYFVSSGEVIVIPSGVPHKVEVIRKTFDLDLFSPPREDWLSGSDQYLREEQA